MAKAGKHIITGAKDALGMLHGKASARADRTGFFRCPPLGQTRNIVLANMI